MYSSKASHILFIIVLSSPKTNFLPGLCVSSQYEELKHETFYEKYHLTQFKDIPS